MAKTLYFSGDVELDRITAISNKDFAKLFPGVKGRKYDGISMQVGQPVDFKGVFVQGQGWTKDYRAVERIVNYKSNPSKHECDARCMNANGRTMNCECSCGGKNHGKGFSCE